MLRNCCLLLLIASTAAATRAAHPLPLVASEDFTAARPDGGVDGWRVLDPHNWRVADGVLSQHAKRPGYQPPHRSPQHVALYDAATVADFELTARVRSTHEDYPGRDACVVFGYQDPAHFYYAHLGKRTDAYHNQIFIVDGADRRQITATTNDGAPWDDAWHTVRVTRDVDAGQIRVYWDNQPKPVMTAVDKTFTWGHVGVGTFDDTADWDDIELRGDSPMMRGGAATLPNGSQPPLPDIP